MQDNLIFVVEDDAGIRELVLYTLRSQGFKCEGFESPAEFWKRLEEVKPVLLILDLMLPDEDALPIISNYKSTSPIKSNDRARQVYPYNVV